MDVAFSCMINFLLKVLAFLYTYNYTGTHFRQHTVFYNKSSINVSQDTIQNTPGQYFCTATCDFLIRCISGFY